MTLITMGIAAAIFGLQMITNKEVITAAKQLVLDIDNDPITGKEKTADVMKSLEVFFDTILPIILEAVIKMVVLDMQNKDGTLQTKLNEIKEK